MAQQPQELVEIISERDTDLYLRFPLNMRLHGGKYGVFRAITTSGLVVRSDASSVLRDILERLKEELEDIVDISGDFLRLKIVLKCEGARDVVLRHVVLACQAQGLRCRYDRKCQTALAF